MKWKVGKLTPPSPEAGAQPGAPNSSVKVVKVFIGMHKVKQARIATNLIPTDVSTNIKS